MFLNKLKIDVGYKFGHEDNFAADGVDIRRDDVKSVHMKQWQEG